MRFRQILKDTCQLIFLPTVEFRESLDGKNKNKLNALKLFLHKSKTTEGKLHKYLMLNVFRDCTQSEALQEKQIKISKYIYFIFLSISGVDALLACPVYNWVYG